MDLNVAIVGAGPAGIAAAVQLKRFGIDNVIFERDRVGGLIRNAYLVENTMLFPEGVKGTEIVKILEKYVERYRLKIIHSEVKKIEMHGDKFAIHTSTRSYIAKYVIVATGTRPKTLPYEGLNYHFTEIDEKCGRIIIIGGGDIALDYAMSSSEMCSEVMVLYRSEIRALKALQDMVGKRKNIKLLRAVVENINKTSQNYKVKTDKGYLQADRILVAIGRVPNIEILNGITHPRIYLAGDVKNGIYRQSSIAIADGIRAAMDIWRRERYGDIEGDRR